MAEDKAVETRTLEFLAEWERSKPTDGSTRPEDALARLQAMETRYTKLKDERDNVAKAKEALELHDTGKIVIIKKTFNRELNLIHSFGEYICTRVAVVIIR